MIICMTIKGVKMNKVKARLIEHYEYVTQKGYEIFGLYLQGSQNYKLETENSDVDTKCIILPSLEDIVLNKPPISTTIVLENNEHIDIKDIRVMFGCFKKQNINFIEILFTEYKIINDKYKDLDDALTICNEEIARIDYNKALKCMLGMAHQKYAALKHPYPSLLDKIEKFGYDPKQLHHIVRLKMFIERYTNGESYKDCLVESEKNRDFLIKIKNGEYSLEEAEIMAREYIGMVNKIYSEHMSCINSKALNILEKVQVEAIKRYLKERLWQD